MKENYLNPGDKVKVIVMDPRKRNLTRGEVYKVYSVQSYEFKVIGDNGGLVKIKKSLLRRGKVSLIDGGLTDKNKLERLREYTREVEMLCSKVLLGTISKEEYDQEIDSLSGKYIEKL